MRILWIANLLFPEAEELLTGHGELKASGGWLIGAAEALLAYGDVELSIGVNTCDAMYLYALLPLKTVQIHSERHKSLVSLV